jgi:hypothetical protein
VIGEEPIDRVEQTVFRTGFRGPFRKAGLGGIDPPQIRPAAPDSPCLRVSEALHPIAISASANALDDLVRHANLLSVQSRD